MTDDTKPTLVVWEGLAEIGGGQSVLLDNVESFEKEFKLEFVLPAKGPLSTELADRGYEIHYVPVGDYNLGEKHPEDVLRFISTLPKAIRQGRQAVQGGDLVYANSTRAFIPAAIVGSLTGTPVVWHLHNILTDEKARIAIECTGHLRSVCEIISVSDTAGAQFDTLDTTTIYNGVDTDQYTPHALLEREYSSEETTFGMVSDVIPQKGHRTAIRALADADGSGDMRLHIAGTPRDEYDWYLSELRSLVSTLGLRDRVHFRGYVEDIVEFYREIDALLIPSEVPFEACPMVALEAYACGTPVIGSDAGGTSELITKGESGWVFKTGDPGALAERLQIVMANSGDESRMRCRELACEKFALKEQSALVRNQLSSTISTVQTD